MIQKVVSIVQSKILSRIYIDSNTDYHNTILLSSLGRSGSTMIANLINANNNYRIIFEPFKAGTVKIAAGFEYPTFIQPADTNPQKLHTLDTIITGKIRTAWTDFDNRKMYASQRLIKDVRTNLMLGWIKNNYPDLPVILLVRNPFAVVESWTRAKWPFDQPKKRLLEQEKELAHFLPEGIFAKYRLANTALANHLYNWCINYYIALQQAQKKNIHITFYENYFAQPEQEIKKLFAYLKKPVPEKALASLNNLSHSTRKVSPLQSGGNIRTAWKKKYTAEEINAGCDILKEFGLADLYDFDGTGLPLHKIQV